MRVCACLCVTQIDLKYLSVQLFQGELKQTNNVADVAREEKTLLNKIYPISFKRYLWLAR